MICAIKTFAIAIAFALAVIALVTLLVFVDEKQLGQMTIQAAEKAIGRHVRIDGALEMELSLAPRLTARGVEIANTPWASHPAMIVADALSARIELLPLLWREIVLNVSLRDAKTIFEVSADGRPNWMLSPESTTESSGDAKWTVKLDRVDITSAAVSYRDWEQDITFDVNIDRLSLQRHREREESDIDLAVTRNGIPVEVSGTIGGKATETEITLDLRASSPGAVVTLRGELDPTHLKRVELALTTEVQAMNDIERLLELDLPDVGELAGGTRLMGRDGNYSLKELDLTAKSPGVSFTAKGSAQRIGPLPQIDLEVGATVKALSALAVYEEILPQLAILPESLPVRATARITGDKGVYSATDIDAHLDSGELDLNLRGRVDDLLGSGQVQMSVSGSVASLEGLPLDKGITSHVVRLLPVAGSLALAGSIDELALLDVDLRSAHPGIRLATTGEVHDLGGTPRFDLALAVEAEKLRDSRNLARG